MVSLLGLVPVFGIAVSVVCTIVGTVSGAVSTAAQQSSN